jgi:CheY-like chemotaxis protein
MHVRRSSVVVLVVEDEWLLRHEIVDHLKDAGWDVLEASTGEDAVSFLETEQHVDVLVTDIQLAGNLNGWDVAEAFRASRPDIPVIYASGNSADPSRAVANSRFFAKPANVLEIMAVISSL